MSDQETTEVYAILSFDHGAGGYQSHDVERVFAVREVAERWCEEEPVAGVEYRVVPVPFFAAADAHVDCVNCGNELVGCGDTDCPLTGWTHRATDSHYCDAERWNPRLVAQPSDRTEAVS